MNSGVNPKTTKCLEIGGMRGLLIAPTAGNHFLRRQNYGMNIQLYSWGEKWRLDLITLMEIYVNV